MSRQLYRSDWNMLRTLAAIAVQLFRDREGHLPHAQEAREVEQDLYFRTHGQFPLSEIRKAVWRMRRDKKLAAAAPPPQ